jgi:hypothetical protein
MADSSSSTAGPAFESGQAPVPKYVSYRIYQNTIAYDSSGNGSSNPPWSPAGRHAVSTTPRYSASSSNINLRGSLTRIPASASRVVPLHTPGYTSHYCTQQSQETAETPPTPGSGADATSAHALDDLLLSYPMISGDGHRELSLQGLDQEGQGISTRRYLDCD